MKSILMISLLAFLVFVECTHTFLGTNVQRPLLHHQEAKYSSQAFRKRVENFVYSIPSLPANAGRAIQGILAVDMTNSEASANVTSGGLGQTILNLRMKSERGKPLHYDIYIYG